MKKLLLIVLVLFTFDSLAQESQSAAGVGYSSGEYQYHNRWEWKEDEPDMKNSFQFNSNVKITIYKSEDGKRCAGAMIDYGGSKGYTIFGLDQPVEMNCYFRSQEELRFDSKVYECLYFNSKGIWLLHLSLDEKSFSVAGYFGKKGPGGKGIYKEIEQFLEKAKPIQEQQLATRAAEREEASKTTASAYEIEYIEFTLLGTESKDLKSGSEFTVGVTTYFTQGEPLLSKNLGGSQNDGEYEITVKGADLVDGKFKVKPYCEDLIDGSLIEVKLVYFPNDRSKRNYDKFERVLYQVNCDKNPKTIVKEKAEDERILKFKTDYEKYLAESPLTLPKQEVSVNVVNDLTSVDTLFSKNSFHRNLALIEEGNDYILLQSNVDVSNNSYPTQSSYILKKISLVNGKYTLAATGTPFSKETDKFCRALNYSQFLKTSTGYVVCSSVGLTFFKKDLSFDFHSNSGDYLMLNCVKLGDKDEFAILAAHKTNYTFYITTYNAVTKTYTSILPFGELSTANAKNTRLIYNSDNSLLVAVNENTDATRYKMYMLSVEDLQKSGQDDFFKCHYYSARMDSRELYDMYQDDKGRVLAVNVDVSEETGIHLESYVVNPMASSYREFSGTWTTHTNYNFEQGIGNYYKFLPNGYLVSYGTGRDNFSSIMTLTVFDRKLNQVGSFRVPTKFDEQIFNDEGNCGGEEANQFTKLMHFNDGETMVYEGLKVFYEKNAETDVENYCKTNLLDAVFDVYPGKNSKEIIILTSTSILKVDLSKSKPCTRKMVQQSDDSDYSSDETDNSSSSSSSTSSSGSGANKTNNSNSSSGKSNSTSSGTGSEFSGNVYFKYDMSGKDRPGEKLYIHSGSNASTVNSTTPGSSATVRCQSGKVYYSFTGKKSDMKEFMELSPSDCGKTFKYTDFE